jgi:PAT family beta-lactamase induction signal transducer AmpG
VIHQAFETASNEKSMTFPFLSSSRWLRYIVFLAYYSMQGLPLGLNIISIPAWLISQGVPMEKVGTFASITILPWALKMVVGPFMDRFSFLPMGMRRPWIMGTQILMLLTTVTFFFIGDPMEQFWLMTGACTLMNIFAASEDVAVDGLAIGIIPEKERGRANAFMAAGQTFGMSLSAWISIRLLNIGGMPAVAFHVMGALAVLFVVTVVIRERPGERFFPWSKGEANPNAIPPEKSILNLFKDLIRLSFQPMIIILLLAIFGERILAGMYKIWVNDIGINTYGYTDEQVARMLSMIMLVTAGMGLAFGPLVDKIGAPRALRIALLFGCFVFLGMYPFADVLAHPSGAVLYLVLAEMGGVLLFISFIASCMMVCHVRIASTQFACFMALGNLGMSFGSAIYPKVISLSGVHGFFFVMAGGYALASLIMTRFSLQAHKDRMARLQHD